MQLPLPDLFCIFTLMIAVLHRSFLLFLLLISTGLRAQTNLVFSVDTTGLPANCKIETLRFYLGHIALKKNGAVTLIDSTYHLVDFQKPTTLTIPLSDQLIHTDTIEFGLGVDSFTSVSGAMGGDLDPTNGMYWAWQSGYVNLKLEGTSLLSKTPGNTFQYHLGGYTYPENCYRSIKLPVKNASKIHIGIYPEKFLSKIDISKINHCMSPGKEAMQMMDIATGMFSIMDL